MMATMTHSESRAEPRREAAGPVRRCLASGELRPKTELLRFVVDPAGRIVFDAAGKLPGRGLWLAPRRDMIERARGRNLFARAAKRPVTVAEDLAEQVAASLRRRCLDLIGLARRAGAAVGGFEKAKAKLAAGEGAVLIQAVDAAPGGRQKLAALAGAARNGPAPVEIFTAAELGGVLGREHTVHLVLAPGAIADRFLTEVARLTALAGAYNAGKRM